MRFEKCISCQCAFSNQNVYSKEGWAETQISGLCEKCFDKATLCEEDDNAFLDEIQEEKNREDIH